MADDNNKKEDLKPYAITSIKAYVPLTLDLSQLNYDAWRVLFETHYKAYGVAGYLDGSTTPTGPDDKNWIKLDSLVVMWIYGTLTQPLLTMVLKDDTSAHDVRVMLQNLFRYNKDSKAIELDNELRTLTQGDRSITDYCQKLSSLADLLNNIGSPVPGKTLVAHLLNGLNPRFDNIATVIRHTKPLPTLLEARSMLLLEENCMDRTRPSQPTHTDHPSAPTVLHTAANRRPSDRHDSQDSRNSNSRNRSSGRDTHRGNDSRRQPENSPLSPDRTTPHRGTYTAGRCLYGRR